MSAGGRAGTAPRRRGPLWWRKWRLRNERIPADGKGLSVTEWTRVHLLEQSYAMPAPADMAAAEQAIENELREKGRAGE